MARSFADEIIYGTRNSVERLIPQGIDVNEIDEYGFTPLIESAIVNKIDIAELLIQQGADVNRPDVTGRTALHWTVENHNLPFCKLLLERAANPNAYGHSGEPILVLPVLRGQTDLKRLLYHYGAELDFALDYINTKLLGHRFELTGQVHIVDPRGNFILLDFEGFIFEFTSSLIQHSLERYKKNFAAKHLQQYFDKIDTIIEALAIASQLIKFQQYTIDIRQHEQRINNLLARELLIIPIAYAGHAITCIKYGNLFVKCDRGAFSKVIGSTVAIYKINNPQALTYKFIKNLIYTVNPEEMIQYGINQVLDLVHVLDLPVPPQIAGNCSWANVEATIPAILLLLALVTKKKKSKQEVQLDKIESMDFFGHWHEWDKDRALDECVQSFYQANPARKASKAAILANIFVHRLKYTDPRDIDRAEKILPVLQTKEYEYILNSYIRVYGKDPGDPIGKNLLHLLDVAIPT